VIDLEGGSDHHAERFQFSRLSTSNAEDAIHSVDWLLTNPHDYRTLVIDPVTVLWDSIQRKWSDIFLKRNKGKKGYKFEFYSLDFKDWATIKGEWKDILRKLTALDMSVVVTARAKTMFEEEGEGRKRQGTEVFDGEKSLPYLFDVILQTFRDGTKYMLRTVKDRTGKLPSGEWESNIEVFTECLGRRVLTKAATPLKIATPAQREAILRLAAQAGMSDAQVQDRILLYGADTLEDLTKVNAQTIIEKLETYLTTTKGRTA
jgi:hypothetical protein